MELRNIGLSLCMLLAMKTSSLDYLKAEIKSGIEIILTRMENDEMCSDGSLYFLKNEKEGSISAGYIMLNGLNVDIKDQNSDGTPDILSMSNLHNINIYGVPNLIHFIILQDKNINGVANTVYTHNVENNTLGIVDVQEANKNGLNLKIKIEDIKSIFREIIKHLSDNCNISKENIEEEQDDKKEEETEKPKEKRKYPNIYDGRTFLVKKRNFDSYTMI